MTPTITSPRAAAALTVLLLAVVLQLLDASGAVVALR